MKNLAIGHNLTLPVLISVFIFMLAGCSTNDDIGSPEVPEETENIREAEQASQDSQDTEGSEEENDQYKGSEQTETPEGRELPEESQQTEGSESLTTIVERVKTADSLGLFVEALAHSDLAETLKGEGPFTLFAPTDAAVQHLFDILGDEYSSFDDFKNPVERQILNEILLGHVVEGKIASEDLEPGTLPTLLPNDSIELVFQGDSLGIKDASGVPANLVSLDLEASNGTVHTIDKILIPWKVLAFVE